MMSDYVYAKSGKYKTLQAYGFVYPIKHKEKKMSDDKKGSMPDYEVVVGTKGKDDKTFWTKIGSAWLKDDKISIRLNAHPMGDSLLLCKPKPREDKK